MYVHSIWRHKFSFLLIRVAISWSLRDGHLNITHFHNITQLMRCVLAALTLDSVWRIGIPTSGVYIHDSNVGPMNTIHQFNSFMLSLFIILFCTFNNILKFVIHHMLCIISWFCKVSQIIFEWKRYILVLRVKFYGAKCAPWSNIQVFNKTSN